MELHVCPNCDAFTRAEWDTCRVCGASMREETATVAPEATEVEDAPIVEESLVEDAPVEEETVEQPADEPTEAPAEDVAEAVEEEPVEEDPTEPAPAAPSLGLPWGAPSAAGAAAAAAAATAPNEAVEQDALLFTPPSSNHTFHQWVAQMRDQETQSSIPVTKWALRIAIVIGSLILLALIGAAVFYGNETADAPATSTSAVVGPSTTVATTAAPSSWVRVNDPAGRFRVELPSAPTDLSAEGVTTLRSASVEGTPSSVYVSGRAIDASANVDQALKSQLDVLQTQMGATVRSNLLSTVAGVRQLNAHLVTNDRTQTIDVRYFVQGNGLYGVWIIADGSDGNPALFGQVTDSFVVTK